MTRHSGQQPTRTSVSNDGDVVLSAVTAARQAASAGFDDVGRQAFATAVSELARNIVKYAGDGEIVVRVVHAGRCHGVEAIATDRGPGIADVELAMTDRFSSGGTLGLGLPGVRRMMDEFEIETALQRGTRVTIRKWL